MGSRQPKLLAQYLHLTLIGEITVGKQISLRQNGFQLIRKREDRPGSISRFSFKESGFDPCR